MKTTHKSAFIYFIICFLSSCAGSKKIDFNTAYKFSRYNYNKTVVENIPNEQRDLSGEKLFVSKEAIPVEGLDERLSQIEEKIYRKIEVSIENGKSMMVDELVQGFKKLDRKEKRELRKEIKTELKHLKHMEAENPSSINESNQTNELTEYMYVSIIIGSVGLVLLLLGAIFSVGFLSVIGALAIVGAAVLFILDQV